MTETTMDVRRCVDCGTEWEARMGCSFVCPRCGYTSTLLGTHPLPQATVLEPGYYWVRDQGNPSMTIREWAPDCGSSGVWFMAGIDGGIEPDRVEVLSGKIERTEGSVKNAG